MPRRTHKPRRTARFTVATYERGMDAGTLDSGESTDVRAAAEFLEDDEEDTGGSAEYPEHMTPEDTTGVPASGMSGTGPGSTAYGRE